MATVVGVLHLAGIVVLSGEPALAGVGLVAYLLGVRHAFDARHVAVIGEGTRKLSRDGRRPLSVGFWFSLGSATTVFSVTFLLAMIVQPSASATPAGVFLAILGALNLVVLIGALMGRGQRYDGSAARYGLLGRLSRWVRHPWQLFPLGVIVGFGLLITAETGLLLLAATAAVPTLPLTAIITQPLLFAAGLCLVGAVQGVRMSAPTAEPSAGIVFTTIVAVGTLAIAAIDLAATDLTPSPLPDLTGLPLAAILLPVLALLAFLAIRRYRRRPPRPTPTPPPAARFSPPAAPGAQPVARFSPPAAPVARFSPPAAPAARFSPPAASDPQAFAPPSAPPVGPPLAPTVAQVSAWPPAPVVAQVSGQPLAPTVGQVSAWPPAPVVAPVSGPPVGPPLAPTVGQVSAWPSASAVAQVSGPPPAPTAAQASGPPFGPVVAQASAPPLGPTVAQASAPPLGPTVAQASAPPFGPTAAQASGSPFGPTVAQASAPPLGPTVAQTPAPPFGSVDEVGSARPDGASVGSGLVPDNDRALGSARVGDQAVADGLAVVAARLAGGSDHGRGVARVVQARTGERPVSELSAASDGYSALNDGCPSAGDGYSVASDKNPAASDEYPRVSGGHSAVSRGRAPVGGVGPAASDGHSAAGGWSGREDLVEGGELSGGVAVVTGAGAGLGRAIALGLAASGYGVVAVDLDAESAEACATQALAYGVAARAMAADVRDPRFLERVVAAAGELGASGGPAVLVNSVAGWVAERYPQVEAWVPPTLDLTDATLLSQLVLEPMRSRGGGAIVNVIAGGAGGDQEARLVRFTGTFAGAAQRFGVRAMCVTADRLIVPATDVLAAVLDLIHRGAPGAIVELRGGDRESGAGAAGSELAGMRGAVKAG
ncbi:SDR family NAD(P)-dependent oxidoreductase [Actinoplanes sp. CA-054009]